MMKLVILLLFFGSTTILAYEGFPCLSFLFERYSLFQNQRMHKVLNRKDQMVILSEKHPLVGVFFILPLLLGVLGFIFSRSPLGALAGGAVGLIIPKIWIKQMAAKRIRDVANQLVDGLMLLSSSLKAGMSLSQAFEVLVEELPPPLSEEFGLAVRENQMGLPMEDCLEHLKKRVPISDIDLVCTAINIARETGGDLTEVFSQLVSTIREKKKLEDRVRALTIQGKLQGGIMAILPFAFGIFIYSMNPENFNIMLEDQLGRTLLVWAVISEVIGILLIKILSKVEV